MKIVKTRAIGSKCIDKLIDNDINLDTMESNNCAPAMPHNTPTTPVIKIQSFVQVLTFSKCFVVLNQSTEIAQIHVYGVSRINDWHTLKDDNNDK